MTDKQFRIVTKSKHFIYFVTEEDENKNWCLKIAVKERFKSKFKKASVDEITGYNVILKIILSLPHAPHYMRFNSYKDSPYKYMELDRPFRNEINKTIKKTNTTYENEAIPFYDYALVQWEDLNDKERFFLYETPNQEMRWFTEPISKKTSGLSMNVELALQPMGKIVNQPPYLIVQNDYEDKQNLNWVKVRLDGSVIDGKKLIFKESEINELKTWIEINKLTILLYWTQEEIDYTDIIKKIKSISIPKS